MFHFCGACFCELESCHLVVVLEIVLQIEYRVVKCVLPMISVLGIKQCTAHRLHYDILCVVIDEV